MSAFLPKDSTAFAVFLVLNLFLIAHAWLVNRSESTQRSIFCAWVLVFGQVLATHLLFIDEASGFRMVALTVATLWAMKGVVIAKRRHDGMQSLTGSSWAWFCFAWVGMEPRAFLAKRLRKKSRIDLKKQGALIVLAVFLLWTARMIFDSRPLIAAIFLMLGLSLILHFTLLRFLAHYLSAKGFKVREPFDRPILSQSLAEFWGNRWNRPFIELGSIAVYRPLQRKLGRGPALFAMFVVSGLLHEMAISLPVQTGYGGPMLYFLLHGGLVSTEEWWAKRGHSVAGIAGRLWTVVWLVAPLPILFHHAFVEEVLLPMTAILGAAN